MMNLSSDYLRVSPGLRLALKARYPVVALESTVISHGLPRPINYEVARRCETSIRDEGVVAATVGIMDGELCIGLTDEKLEQLAMEDNVRKVSRRDMAVAVASGGYGATTVAATMIAAHMAGVRIFATGGIGGVHRGMDDDISADLTELGRTPVVVVCAGAKSILDLPRTLEYLETQGVPVIGYQTDVFPAFYARESGLVVDAHVDSIEEMARVVHTHFDMGLQNGMVLAVPPPARLALAASEMESAVEQAIRDAEEQQVRGKALTPFLLSRVSDITQGHSREVNVALLEQNARIAARLAVAVAQLEGELPQQGWRRRNL